MPANIIPEKYPEKNFLKKSVSEKKDYFGCLTQNQ
jgi:hypothetical protein